MWSSGRALKYSVLYHGFASGLCWDQCCAQFTFSQFNSIQFIWKIFQFNSIHVFCPKKNQFSSIIQVFNSSLPYSNGNNMHVHKQCSRVIMPPLITPPSLIAKKTLGMDLSPCELPFMTPTFVPICVMYWYLTTTKLYRSKPSRI